MPKPSKRYIKHAGARHDSEALLQCRFMDYIEWALDVPIYFLERWGQKMVVGHPSFRDFLERGLEIPNGRGRTYATPDDWQLHLTTVFPWVRLRNYIELRAFDSNAPDIVLAIVALVKGPRSADRPRGLHKIPEKSENQRRYRLK